MKILNLKLVMLLEYPPKYNNIFAKGYVPNSSVEVLIIIEVKNTVPWTYVISGINGNKIARLFYEKILQNTNQKK